MVGMPVYGRIPSHTTMSLAHTAYRCGAGGVVLDICMEVRGIVTWARDAVLDSFLQSDARKLFWIDSDIVWEPDDFLKMVALSSRRDIVCAAYPTKTDAVDFQIAGTDMPQEADELGLIEIEALGLGFAIMDRKVCEDIASGTQHSYDTVLRRELPDVFRTDHVETGRRGEDIAFFDDLRALGHKVYLDPTITLGHVGEKIWKGRAIDTFKRIDHAEG